MIPMDDLEVLHSVIFFATAIIALAVERYWR
jgi:hypothetical protein